MRTRTDSGVSRHLPPARTVEEREDQLISKAYDLAEQRIDQGIAKSQEIVYFLKMGSSKERQEREILAQQAELMKAKTEAIQSQKRVEELYSAALSAMKTYSGGLRDEDDPEV